jgi:hypothetical protein
MLNPIHKMVFSVHYALQCNPAPVSCYTEGHFTFEQQNLRLLMKIIIIPWTDICVCIYTPFQEMISPHWIYPSKFVISHYFQKLYYNSSNKLIQIKTQTEIWRCFYKHIAHRKI